MNATGPVEFFTADHRRCDEGWGAIERAVDDGDTARAHELFEAFHAAMLRHFEMEEQVLFPELEAVTGMHGCGPTEVMRMEHEQMRAVLDGMAASARAGDYESLLDHGDTLLMLVQQHNVKEEGMLYPMAQQQLAARWSALATRLSSY
ncbi:MAG: hemerythrin domain-containing protein [Myxococcales bacterium]|nr:hemerythrin domain-containing protein [Myxococcales bacterium]